ncbi:hypothetical protein [Acidihalobacter prosperus]
MGRSDDLDLASYDTDKVASGYMRLYDELFADRWPTVEAVFEMGIKDGGSLKLWADYFPAARIAGLDLRPPQDLVLDDRIRMYSGRQEDSVVLAAISDEIAPGGFDLIIDDAAHCGRLSEASYEILFDNHLKPGGIYVVEDWGTGYWPDWYDGGAYRPRDRKPGFWQRVTQRLGLNSQKRLPSHDYGMVGFIKRLIDRQAVADITKGFANAPCLSEPSTIERLIISSGIAIVVKSRMIDKCHLGQLANRIIMG